MWLHEHGCVLAYVSSIPRAGSILSASSLAPPYFSTLSHKQQDYRKKVSEDKMCVLIFSTTFVRNISHSNKNSARYCHKCENVFT